MMKMERPTLSVQTVFFHGDDREPARELGYRLYDLLTRSRSERLSFGAGIPVWVGVRGDLLQLERAAHEIVVPVLGAAGFEDEETRERVGRSIVEWKAAGGGCASVLPVLLSPNWEMELARLGGEGGWVSGAEQEAVWKAVPARVVRLACERLFGGAMRLQILVSHAQRDRLVTREVSEAVRMAGGPGDPGLVDVTELRPGDDLSRRLEETRGCGVFLAIRTDSYAARTWCQRELLWAKQSRMPTLMLEVLERGEVRSSPYGGNGPTMLWTGDASAVVVRAMVEWLKARHFEREAQRWTGDLPRAVVLPRAPELLDLAQGPLLEKGPTLVLHPDPEISVAERQLLREARPRMRLVTPSTLYRGQLRRDGGAGPGSGAGGEPEVPASPLFGRQVALALSESPDADAGDRGFVDEHVDDVVVQVARALIAAGSAIAYGGDFRRGGFDELLSQLIVAYNDSGVDRARYLYSYLPATLPRTAVPSNLPVTLCSLRWSPKVAEDAVLPAPEGEVSAARAALYLSDMRRVMTRRCFARVLLGGSSRPVRDGGGEGYRGPFPGILEEAWHALRHGLPLYVLGGFGGGAALVAELMGGHEVPELLKEAAFAGPEYAAYRRMAQEYGADPERTRVEAPVSLGALVEDVRERLARHLASDAASRAWNGLGVEENLELARSRDPLLITRWVMKGLLGVVSAAAKGKLRVQLVRGSITQAEAVDALAIATLRDVPLGGAGAALDQTLSRRITTALRSRETLVEVPTPEVDADWLVIVDLGALAEGALESLPEAIERGARQVAETGLRHGFRRVALVSFGGNVIADPGVMVDRMIRGLGVAGGRLAVDWYELDAGKFEDLRGMLGARGDVILSTRVMPPVAALTGPPVGRDVVLTVRYEGDQLHTTLLPPTGAAAALAYSRRVSADEFRALTRSDAVQAPALADLEVLGARLGLALLGEDGVEVLGRLLGSRVVIQHDLASSPLPFEAMGVKGRQVSIESGMLRRPVLERLRLCDVTCRPAHLGSLNLLLVVNPTGDLKGTEAEAEAVVATLKDSKGVVVRRELRGEAATKSAVLQALRDPDIDVLHYSGHAFFEGAGGVGSGLLCAGHEPLLMKDLLDGDVVPRMVFFNACQSARVRRLRMPEVAQAFAEYFLRSPVEAYVGTVWPVGDAAAARFAARAYLELAQGVTLDAAVRGARAHLRDAGEADWANYVLYGDGSFRFVQPG